MVPRTLVDDIVQGAFNQSILECFLPAMRSEARSLGYSLALHGSLNHDIDIIAVPWVEDITCSPIDLIRSLCMIVSKLGGLCIFDTAHDLTQSPHGRLNTSLILYCGEGRVVLDLSIIPTNNR